MKREKNTWANPKGWLMLPVFSLFALLMVLYLRDYNSLYWYFGGAIVGVPVGLFQRGLVRNNRDVLSRFFYTPYIVRMYDDELVKTSLKVTSPLVFLLFSMVHLPESAIAVLGGMGSMGVIAYRAWNELWEKV